MAGRTAAEAVRNFLEPLQRTVSCVTRAVLNVRGGYYATGEVPHALTLGDGLPRRLSGEPRLYLSIKQLYHVIPTQDPDRGPWKVSPAEYNYSLRYEERRMLIAYHWHPDERFKVRTPHLHLGPGAEVGRAELDRIHIPTGRVAVEDIIRFAVDELGVAPLRDDWREVLAETRRAYED